MSNSAAAPLPSTAHRVVRSFLRQRTLFLASILLIIPLCYTMASYKLSRENEQDILALDLEVAPHFLGTAKVTKWGLLKRSPVVVTCSGGAPGQPTVDWANTATCMSNAVLHTNCVPVCDSSFSSCPGCTALQTDHDTQLTVAQDRCQQRANLQCTLGVKGNGRYDYASLSNCCLTTLPFTASACLCENQLSSAPTCFGLGQCMANCATASLRTTCSGRIATLPTAPATCANPLALTCSSSSVGSDLTCSTGSYFYAATGTCYTTCPPGSYAKSGTTTCLACPDSLALTCPNGKSFTCPAGLFINIYYGGTTCTTCGTGQATCVASPYGGAMVTSCNAPLYLQSTLGGASASCLSSCSAGYAPVNGVCSQCSAGTYAGASGCTPCPASLNASKCSDANTATACGIAGYPYFLNGACLASCPAPTSSTAYLPLDSPYYQAKNGAIVCQESPLTNVNALPTNGGMTHCPTLVGTTVQLYLNAATGTCSTKNYCNVPNSGSIATVSGATYGTCTPCFDTNAAYCTTTASGKTTLCADTPSYANGYETYTQYYYKTATKTCVIGTGCSIASTSKSVTTTSGTFTGYFC